MDATTQSPEFGEPDIDDVIWVFVYRCALRIAQDTTILEEFRVQARKIMSERPDPSEWTRILYQLKRFEGKAYFWEGDDPAVYQRKQAEKRAKQAAQKEDNHA